ncbi:MAG TPA: hypothetical protein VMD49_04795 [Steroidobacteraceae bacterium]|nr:hypothetical protein [Steroidobacteraceae bacterium]
MRFRKLSGVITVLAFSVPAAAGTYIEASRTDLRDPLRALETQKMWFDGGSFRLEDERASAVEIFKGHTLYLVEPARRRFAAVDESRLEALANGSRPAGGPAATAAALRAAHGAASGASDASDRERVAHVTSRTETSDGETCTVWEITVGDEKVEELCVVPVAAVPGGAAILADMRNIGELIRARRLGESLRSSAADSWDNLDAVDGIPLISRTFQAGRAIVEFRITAVRSEPVPFTAFEIPAGFRRRPLERGGI